MLKQNINALKFFFIILVLFQNKVISVIFHILIMIEYVSTENSIH